MDRNATIFLGIVFLIGIAGFLIFLEPNDATAPPPPPDSATQTYTSSAHGFSLSYPATLSHLEYNPDTISIGTLTEGGIDAVAEVRIFIMDTPTEGSFTDAVVATLAMFCAADGPTGSFSCAEASRSQTFTTTSGATGTEVYLTGEMHDFTADTRTPVEKGPYFIFPLAMPQAVLVVHAPLNQSAAEADIAAIRAIAESVQID